MGVGCRVLSSAHKEVLLGVWGKARAISPAVGHQSLPWTRFPSLPWVGKFLRFPRLRAKNSGQMRDLGSAGKTGQGLGE